MRNLVILLLSLIAFEGFTQTTPGNCTGFVRDRNRIIFDCDRGSRVLVEVCGHNVVKVWFDPAGDFERTNPSFAVVDEALDNLNDLHVENNDRTLEIFTNALRIRIDKSPFRLQFFDKYQKLIVSDYGDQGHVADSGFVASRKTIRRDEKFFGLGEKAGSINRRGNTYKMWNSDKPCYSVSEDPLYKSIPFFMSSYNYGIFFDNTFKSEFDFGSTSNDQLTFSAPGGELIYYVITGNSYKEIIYNYTRLTGQPIMPPKWALGFSQSRGLLTREDLSREIAQGYRDREIPCDIIYQDIGWTQFLQDFEWRRENYVDPKKMLHDLSSMGFKVIVSQDPVVSQANQKQWSAANSAGYFVRDVRTGETYDMPWPWGGDCGVVDFTNPDVADWWGALQQKPIDDGVKGFWTDMGEPAWSNEESEERLFMKHHAGMHAEIHNVYGFTWDKVVTEQFEKRNPNQRIFQMTRAGFAGMQRYTFGWSGDAGNGSNVLDGWGQLKNQIQVGLSAGMGLIPFWSCDISGYCGDITDNSAFAELYVRWTQFGVFNPISRAHHEGNNAVEPWLFGAEAERIVKSAIELKYQLFPYLYSYAREAFDTGVPIMRAAFLEYPNDEKAVDADEQFFFGKELLVAPVVEKGASTKRVYLPEGEWILFENGATRYKGGGWIELPVRLETIPLFVKAGSIIPMMPVMQYIHERENHPITLKAFPKINSTATFTLYEDDGVSNDYKRDVGARTKFECTWINDALTFHINARESNGYTPPKRNYLIELPMSEKPKSVTLNGGRIKMAKAEKVNAAIETDFTNHSWFFDKSRNVVVIRTVDTGGDLVISVK